MSAALGSRFQPGQTGVVKPTEKTIREAVGRFGPLVLHKCRAFTRNRHLAEDLAQEVFARICEVAGKPCRDRADIPKTLVEGIMQNVFLEYLRRKKRSLPTVHSEVDCMDQATTPADQVATEDQWTAIRSLVDELMLPERQVILGRHFLGMSIADLTRFLRTPRSTVLDTYNRGMSRLRSLAKDHGLLP